MNRYISKVSPVSVYFADFTLDLVYELPDEDDADIDMMRFLYGVGQ